MVKFPQNAEDCISIGVNNLKLDFKGLQKSRWHVLFIFSFDSDEVSVEEKKWPKQWDCDMSFTINFLKLINTMS